MTDSAPSTLAFTGERFLPEVTGEIWHEHWHRYVLAMPVAAGRRVLDAACGEGYGSALLGRVAREVTGIDVAPEAASHARARYGTSNVRFAAASCTALPLPDASFDVVVSFETIEHLAEQCAMLAEFRRVLAPDGVLVLSSPNRPAYAALGPGRNEFHVRELDRTELSALLAPVFPQQRWYGQSIVARSAVWAEGAPRPDASAWLAIDGDRVDDRASPGEPVYFLVVAGGEGAALPVLPALSLFGDPKATLLAAYRASVARAAQLHWDERNAMKIADEREARLVVAVNELARERDDAAALRARAADLEQRLARAEHEVGALRQRVAWRETFGGWWRWPIERLRAKPRDPAP